MTSLDCALLDRLTHITRSQFAQPIDAALTVTPYDSRIQSLTSSHVVAFST